MKAIRIFFTDDIIVGRLELEGAGVFPRPLGYDTEMYGAASALEITDPEQLARIAATDALSMDKGKLVIGEARAIVDTPTAKLRDLAMELDDLKVKLIAAGVKL